MKKLLVPVLSGAAFLVSAPDSRASSVVNCRENPGYALCNAVDSVYDQLNWTCTGEACYPLWRDQEASMDQLSSFIMSTPGPGDSTDVGLGLKAQSLAQLICGLNQTGDVAALVDLIYSENQLLGRLERVQRLSPIEPQFVKTCTIELQRRL